MCEALRELFADDLRESREEGIMEGRNVGKREGKLEGKREGEASKVIEIVIKKYKKGCSVKETADMLEEPQTLIKQIYDVIGQCGTRPEDGSEIKNTVKTKTQSYIRRSQMQSCVQTGRN